MRRASPEKERVIHTKVARSTGSWSHYNFFSLFLSPLLLDPQDREATYCSFSGPIQLEAVRWLESTVQQVQCPGCGLVSKAKVKEQSVIIAPHPQRKMRAVRNVSRWVQQNNVWVMFQKKEL